MMTPNTVGRMESRLGAPPVKMPSPPNSTPGIIHGGVTEKMQGLEGHEFANAPYSLAGRGIGGTTRQFGA